MRLEAIESVFSELREERSFIHFCWATASYPREAQSAAELIRLAEHRLSIEQRRIRHEEEERQRHWKNCRPSVSWRRVSPTRSAIPSPPSADLFKFP